MNHLECMNMFGHDFLWLTQMWNLTNFQYYNFFQLLFWIFIAWFLSVIIFLAHVSHRFLFRYNNGQKKASFNFWPNRKPPIFFSHNPECFHFHFSSSLFLSLSLLYCLSLYFSLTLNIPYLKFLSMSAFSWKKKVSWKEELEIIHT